MGVSTTSAHATLDALSDPVIVIGPGGAVQLVNRAGAALLGEETGAIVGRPLESLFPERIHEVEGTPVLTWLQRSARGAQRPLRIPIRRHDGVEIHQVVQVSATSADDDGAVTILLLRSPNEGPDDIELDPLHLGAATPAIESSLRRVFESVPVGVLHFDDTGRITACNDVFVAQMGSSRHVLIGLDMCTLANQGVVLAVREALAGRDGLFDGEYISATGGRRRIYNVRFSPVMRDGKVEGGVGIVDDVTERRAIEERLAQGERMASLGRLAAGVAHEINNPLAYVRTSLDIARRRLVQYRGSSEVEHLEGVDDGLRRAYDGVERVRVIASDLKTFSRGDDGSWLPVQVAKVVDTAINLASAEIKSVAALEREVDQDAYVMGSETRFVQVVVNLLVNAAQAIEGASPAEGGRIAVRVEVEGDEVRIDVEDNGDGIAPDRIPHVFEPFWTSKPRGTGTGLGLSICHGIVTSAGGEIRILRSAPSRGTTVRVTLPASQQRTSSPSKDDVTVRDAATSRPRVLVIDDELRLAKTLALGLGDRYRIDIVDSGRGALEILRAAPVDGGEAYDLVLCDLMMPDLSGMDVYETIVSERPDLARRFVFMTGGAFTDRARDFLNEGGLRRLEKPFALEDVERLVTESEAR